MAVMVRPSARVAANRRRVFLWAPLLLVGALVSLAGGPMVDVFNSLDVVGAAMMLAGLFGFVSELDR